MIIGQRLDRRRGEEMGETGSVRGFETEYIYNVTYQTTRACQGALHTYKL